MYTFIDTNQDIDIGIIRNDTDLEIKKIMVCFVINFRSTTRLPYYFTLMFLLLY